MTRSKRTSRPARKAATGAVNRIKTSAIAAMKTLVKQGATIRREGGKLALAKARSARIALGARADEARVRAVDAVSHLEKVFETRVSQAISKLGVPTSRDMRALSRQVAALQQSVDRLRRTRARA